MRRRLLIAIALGCSVPHLLGAQGVPRQPVNPVRRGSNPTPTPPPSSPDPSGVYSGAVTFTLGTQGTFTHTWRISLKAQPCPECPAGQYVVRDTDYELVNYIFGTERGSVWGVIDPGGDGFIELKGVNCNFLSLGLGGASFFYSGGLGPSAGNRLHVANGVISGRISGYDCFGQLVFGDVHLTKESGAARTCTFYGGDWSGSYVNSCGGSAQGYTNLQQAGCVISGYSAAAKCAIDATITGPSTATVRINFTDGCKGSATGSAEITNGVISGNYSGTIDNDSFGCCLPGPISGSFTLSR